DVVKFGTVTAAAVSVVDSNTLQVTVPRAATAAAAAYAGATAMNPKAGGTTVDVSVTHNGVTSTLAQAFTYYPAPAHTWASGGFESGSAAPFSLPGAGNSIVTTMAH